MIDGMLGVGEWGTPIWNLPINTMTLVVRALLPHTASSIRHISAELKVAFNLRLAVVRGYKYKKIRKITGISERTTQCVRALHQRAAGICRTKEDSGTRWSTSDPQWV